MKKLIIITILFIYSLSNAQTLHFTTESQEVSLSEKFITLKVSIANNSPQKTNAPFVVEIAHKASDTTIFPTMVGRKIEENIYPNNYNGPISIKIPWDFEKAKDTKGIAFTLKNKNNDKRFSILEAFHFVYPFKKKKKTIALGLIETDNDLIKSVFTNDEISFPFAIIADTPGISKTDSVTVVVSLTGTDGLAKKDTISYDPSSPIHEIVLSKKKDSSDFEKIKEALKKFKSIGVKLAEATVSDVDYDVNIESSKGKVQYKFEEANLFKPTYRMFLGTNFDLKDRFEATSFYSDIEVFLPNSLGKRLGFRAGIYKNNNSTKLEDEASQGTIFEIVETTETDLTYQEKRVNTTPSVAIENLGLYVQGLWSFGGIRSKNFKIFLAPHIEVIERREKYTFETTDLITLGQETISLSDLSNNVDLQRALTRSNTFTRKYIDTYFGVGVPVLYKTSDNEFEIFLNPGFGLGQPGLSNDKTKAYILTQFHIIYGGKGVVLKLGGEVRRYFGFFQDPIVSVNLSASVPLDSLLGKD